MKNYIKILLLDHKIDPSEIERYNEPHRFYHNYQHIESMLISARDLHILNDELALAIIFHDIIYDPKSTDNEEKSAELFYSYVKNKDIIFFR